MNAKEFSDQFDILWNNIASNQSPGLNEYEKSVFLTKAQDELIKNYFSPKGNAKQEGFDGSPKRQADFSMLLKTCREKINKFTTPSENNDTPVFDPRAIVVNYPKDLFLTVNEQVTNEDFSKIRQVIPISFVEYTRLMSKPYKEPLKYQAWRLLTNQSTVTVEGYAQGDKYITPTANLILNLQDRKALKELIAKNNDKGWYYAIRYVKRPMPIILEDLTEAYGEDLTINGYNGTETFYTGIDSTSSLEITEPRCCELDPAIHEEVLQRAIELAKAAWPLDQNQAATQAQMGQRSE